jgi:hypothetical protein
MDDKTIKERKGDESGKNRTQLGLVGPGPTELACIA